MRLVENETRIKMNQRRNFVNYATMTLSDGTVLNLTPADFRISGNSFTDDWVDGEAFQIGSVIGKTATMLLDNTDGRTEVVGTDTITYPNGKFSEYDFYMAYFTLYVCFPDAYTYGSSVRDQMIRIGKFTVVNPVANSSTIEITGVDEMYKFDQSFDDCTLDFSSGVSLISILNRCCEDCKVAIGYTGFENENLVVTKKPEGVTYRQVVSYVCQMAGCNAVISETGALTLKWYTDVNTAFAGLDGGTFNNSARHHVPDIVDTKTWTSGDYIYWGLSYPDPLDVLGYYNIRYLDIEPLDPENDTIDVTIEVINDMLPEPQSVLKTVHVTEAGVVNLNTQIRNYDGDQYFINITPNQEICSEFTATMTCQFEEPTYAGEEKILWNTGIWTGSSQYSGPQIYFGRFTRSGRYRVTKVHIDVDDPSALTGTEAWRVRVSEDGGTTWETDILGAVRAGDNDVNYTFNIPEDENVQYWFQIGRSVIGEDPQPFSYAFYYVPISYADGDTADGGSFYSNPEYISETVTVTPGTGAGVAFSAQSNGRYNIKSVTLEQTTPGDFYAQLEFTRNYYTKVVQTFTEPGTYEINYGFDVEENNIYRITLFTPNLGYVGYSGTITYNQVLPYPDGDTIDGGNFTTPLPYHNLSATKATQVSTDDVEFTAIVVKYSVEDTSGENEKTVHYRSYDHYINFPSARGYLTRNYVGKIFRLASGGTSSDDTMWVFPNGADSVTLSKDDYITVVDTDEIENRYKFKEFDWQYYTLTVSDNPLITTDNVTTVANTLWARVGGMKFRPFSCSTIQDPTIEAGDCVLVYDTKGNEYRTVVTNVNFATGGYTDLSCKAESAIKQNSRYVSSTALAVIQSQKRMNDYNAQVAHFNELASEALGYYQTVENNLTTGATITYIHNAPSLVNSTIIWKVTGDGIFISEDGGQSYNSGYDASTGTMLMNLVYAKGLSCDWIKTGTLDTGIGQEYGKGAVFRAFTDFRINSSTINVTSTYAYSFAVSRLIDNGYIEDAPLGIYVSNVGTGTFNGYATIQQYINGSLVELERINLTPGYNLTITKIDHTLTEGDPTYNYRIYCSTNGGASYTVEFYSPIINTSIDRRGIKTNNLTLTGGSFSGATKMSLKSASSQHDTCMDWGITWADSLTVVVNGNYDGGLGVAHTDDPEKWAVYVHYDEIQLYPGSYTAKYAQWGTSPSSDRRLKTNVRDLTSEILQKFYAKLQPIIFNYIEEKQEPGTYFGVFAQDVETALDEIDIEDSGIVYEDKDGYKNLSYCSMIGIQIGAVKDLYSIVNRQQEEINDLKQRIEQLENIVNNSK